MLIIIRGIPGSGKTTLAENVKSQYLDLNQTVGHFEADMFFNVDGKYSFDKNKIHLAHKWCRDQVESSLITNDITIVSNTFTRIRELKPYIELANKSGHECMILEATNEYENVHNVPQETIERMKSRFAQALEIINRFGNISYYQVQNNTASQAIDPEIFTNENI